jgi:hypothetical protein
VGVVNAARFADLAAELARYRAAPRPDADRRTRSRVLVAMQHDPRPDDAPLVRALFEAEIRDREADDADTFNGLDLAAFLLARFRDPADAALFARAKRVDFDAACGFDREYLADGGFSADELATWWAGKQAWYPARWEDESVDVLVDLAITWDDRAWASALLDGTERGATRDASFLTSLARHRREIGELDAAVAALREAAPLTVDPSRRASQAQTICACLLEAGHVDEAAAAFAEASALTQAVGDWHRIGLGRQMVEHGFAVAEALPIGEPARALVRSTQALAAQLTMRPPVLLERAAAAARRHGDPSQ